MTSKEHNGHQPTATDDLQLAQSQHIAHATGFRDTLPTARATL
ncbi:hypothetical protein [Streptomyces griseomycini]|nr:hypothetical protein [Streptomyces griseomycini]